MFWTGFSSQGGGRRVCGLMGFVSGTGRAQARVEAIAAGMRCARHRGPDDAGTWHDDDVVFGFNRLSIIDIEHSHQPLRWGPPETPDRYALVFNGEIYNYLELRSELATKHGALFNTEGDGEAIVAAYPLLGCGRGVAAARDVRVPDLGHPGPGAVRRAGPVRHQTAVRRADPGRRCVLLGGEGTARADRPGQRECACAAALSGAAVRSGAGDHGPEHPEDRVRHARHRAVRVGR